MQPTRLKALEVRVTFLCDYSDCMTQDNYDIVISIITQDSTCSFCQSILGVMDSSGIELFYTSQPREHEAGILTLGHVVTSSMLIPPRTDKYDIIGMCVAQCTSQVCY